MLSRLRQFTVTSVSVTRNRIGVAKMLVSPAADTNSTEADTQVPQHEDTSLHAATAPVQVVQHSQTLACGGGVPPADFAHAGVAAAKTAHESDATHTQLPGMIMLTDYSDGFMQQRCGNGDSDSVMRIQASMHDGLCNHGLPVHFNTAQRRNLVPLAGSGPERPAETFTEYLSTASLAQGDHKLDAPMVDALNSARNVGADVEFWRDVCGARHHKPTHRHVAQRQNNIHKNGFFTALAWLAESLNAGDSVHQQDWNAAARSAALLCMTSPGPAPPLSQLAPPQPALPPQIADTALDDKERADLAAALLVSSLSQREAVAGGDSTARSTQQEEGDPPDTEELSLSSHALCAALRMESVFTPGWVVSHATTKPPSRAFVEDVTRRAQQCA